MRCRGIGCTKRAYNSLPPPKCANGQPSPFCKDEFGPRGTQLDLKQCKCVPICAAGKDYYAASHFWPDTKCLTKAEYQVLKPTEFKAFEQMQKQGVKIPTAQPGMDIAPVQLSDITDIFSLTIPIGEINIPVWAIGGGLVVLVLLLK